MDDIEDAEVITIGRSGEPDTEGHLTHNPPTFQGLWTGYCALTGIQAIIPSPTPQYLYRYTP